MSDPTPRRGLLIDWGGVLTTNLFSSFDAFCRGEGLEARALRTLFTENRDARRMLIDFECGRVTEEVFVPALCGSLGLAPERAEGMIDRIFAGSLPDEAMRDAVRAARRAGIPTGLISNSWGTRHYPRQLLDELFDAVVISGEVGIRKPAPDIYVMGADAIGQPPAACVFVDDLPFNLDPARELGMAAVLHTDASTTVPELERLLGVGLS
jgi:putative hydrolase of the HAD superfamily